MCDGCCGNKKPPVRMLACLTVWSLCTADRNSRKGNAETLSDPHWKTYHVQTQLCPVCRGWPPEEPKGEWSIPSQSCPFPSPSFQHLTQAHILTTTMLAAGPCFLPLPSSTFWAWIGLPGGLRCSQLNACSSFTKDRPHSSFGSNEKFLGTRLTPHTHSCPERFVTGMCGEAKPVTCTPRELSGPPVFRVLF